MSKIYIVTRGCYDDWQMVGYFLTREEAKTYCKWRNQYEEGPYYNYQAISALNFEKEKEKRIVYYEAIIWGWEEIAYLDKYLEYRREGFQHQYSCVDTSKEGLEFVFKLYVDTEEAAERITYETLNQIKKVYEATHDFTKAMATVGGTVESA